VLILSLEELIASALNGKSVVADVLRFLELDTAPLYKIDTSRVENGFAVARWSWARRMAGANWVRRAGQILVPVSLGANHTVKRWSFSVTSSSRAETSDRCANQGWLRSISDPM
jgi:hypothetical protein